MERRRLRSLVLRRPSGTRRAAFGSPLPYLEGHRVPMSRRCPPPWTVEKIPGGFKVKLGCFRVAASNARPSGAAETV